MIISNERLAGDPGNEPAKILERIDCGSGQDYGICRVCHRGHGQVIWRSDAAAAEALLASAARKQAEPRPPARRRRRHFTL